MASKLEILEGIEKSTQGFDYFKPKDAKKLVEQGLIEMHETMVDEAGNHACRLTDAGKAYLKSINETSGATAETVKENSMPAIVVLSNVPVPKTTRKAGQGRPSKYPFDTLEVGGMFFVPATEKQPDPAKTLGSVVSSANRRYATESGETKKNRKGEDVPKLIYGRKFIVRAYTHEGVAGAGVWREK